ncbi:pyruvate kinase [Candidatus Woesearchaeota archaeon]|nr:pyruvate kinase [Candidatus Woesearchaeota archaeon]
MKFTKIVATIGPASDSEETIRKMYEAGMNVARLNFSHGAYDYFAEVITRIRRVSDKIAILLDTKGPEIRTGRMRDDCVQLVEHNEVLFTSEEVEGTDEMITINYSSLDSLEPGNTILIDDGLIEFEVLGVQDGKVRAKILNGGFLGSKKTVTIRGHDVQLPFLSSKDIEDIEFGISHDVDFVAASFIRNQDEVRELKRMIQQSGKNIRVISKIEHADAVENINEIIDSSQGIMIARGDLGVELPLEKVPWIQNRIIKRCNELGRPVIVATQMLESMKDNPRPTRAEVADVANAIRQGADAIMLSGETAAGKYPVESIKVMSRIAAEYDPYVKSRVSGNFTNREEYSKHAVSIFVTKAAYQCSEDLRTAAILTPTESGYTARKVSRFKPRCPIYAITHSPTVMRQLAISWGVFPMCDKEYHSDHDQMVNALVKKIFDGGHVKADDHVVVTSGHIMSRQGFTNMLEVYRVNCIINRANNNQESC